MPFDFAACQMGLDKPLFLLRLSLNMKNALVLLSVTLLATAAYADPRPFTFVYDTYPIGKGNVEYEQWVTYRAHSEDDHDFQRLDFRHEFEFGVADNFDLSLYLASWRWEDTRDHTGTHFDSASVEGIVYLLNPVTDAFGLGLYAEFAIGEDELEFEQKLLLQKDVGKWTFAYNLIFETEVEGVFRDDRENEVEGVIGHALGASYQLAPSWRVGAEMTIESIFEDWDHYEDTVVYLGPNFSYTGGTLGSIGDSQLGWWVTLTPTFQLTRVDDEPDFQIRLIAGLEF